MTESSVIEGYSVATGGVDRLRRAFSGFPCGIASVAALIDGEPTVLIVSSFTVGVSQDPPLVLFAVQNDSTTWPLLRGAGRVGVSVLGEGHAATARQLAAKDRRLRFAGVETVTTPNGAILLTQAPVWLECALEHTYPAGDHEIVVLRVVGLEIDFDHNPLIWHRSDFATLGL